MLNWNNIVLSLFLILRNRTGIYFILNLTNITGKSLLSSYELGNTMGLIKLFNCLMPWLLHFNLLITELADSLRSNEKISIWKVKMPLTNWIVWLFSHRDDKCQFAISIQNPKRERKIKLDWSYAFVYCEILGIVLTQLITTGRCDLWLCPHAMTSQQFWFKSIPQEAKCYLQKKCPL